ncbi:MAG: hypothetical protein IJJ42_08735 [Clostridia bacterium]|nr:hypothetical protein [Clostridia bacterium]
MIFSDKTLEQALPNQRKQHISDSSEISYCCIFCKSGSETLVARTMEYCGFGRALFPQRVVPVCRRGIWQDERKALLPGYVFLEGSVPSWYLHKVNHAIRLLRYDDGTSRLRGYDQAFADELFNVNGMFPKLRAVREGDFVRVTDKILQNVNGRVLRVDKRKHIAEIEILLAGALNRVWLGLDMLETKTVI